jgi:N-acetylmuramoyl-L-alanine amidase
MIKNGIIIYQEMMGIPVETDLIEPIGKRNVRTLKPMTPKGITLHNTGNLDKTAGARQHGDYLQKLEEADEVYKSWHITVSHDRIVQHLPLTEQAYHAGDGDKGFGNASTIAIEITENAAYHLAESNGIYLVVALMCHYGFDKAQVQPHRRYSRERKLCPSRILHSQKTWETDWEQFMDEKILPLLKDNKDETFMDLGAVPDWGKATVEKLVNKGYLKGKGETLELSEDMVRLLVIHDRAGLYE